MLAIDIGNSRIKWAVLNGIKVLRFSAAEYTVETFLNVLNDFELPAKPVAVAVSLVGSVALKSELTRWLSAKGFTDIRFAQTHKKECGIINSYKEPANMGVDRWLAMVAAFSRVGRTGRPVCVIDCGTAITVDFIQSDGQHMGGLILPGYQTMLRSLIRGAENINEKAQASLPESAWRLGKDTLEAIEQGCAQQIVFGLQGVIQNQQDKTAEHFHCLVTGGDGEWVSKMLRLENESLPYLVLQGLYEVNKNNDFSG